MKFIRTFHEVGIQDVGLVGGKNASIGELCQHLTALEIRVPCGFAVTVAGFDSFIRQNQLDHQLNYFIRLSHYSNWVCLPNTIALDM